MAFGQVIHWRCDRTWLYNQDDRRKNIPIRVGRIGKSNPKVCFVLKVLA